MPSDPLQSVRTIYSLHSIRHPERSADRLASEVRDFLLRAAGLTPDARTIQDGALDAVPASVKRDAVMLVMKSTQDITNLYRKEQR